MVSDRNRGKPVLEPALEPLQGFETLVRVNNAPIPKKGSKPL